MPVTRFAPSPTGLLHIGHAQALSSPGQMAGGGPMLLRLEDTDVTRCRLNAPPRSRQIWLG